MATYDLIFTIFVLATVLLAAAAIFTWFKSDMQGFARPLWLLIILLFPIVGSLGFLLAVKLHKAQ